MKSTFLLVTLCLPLAAAADELSCPGRISVHESLQTPLPAGWSVSSGGNVSVLDGLTFYDGPPDKLVSLAPMDADEHVSVWTFGPATDLWLSCRYVGTMLTLSKRLTKHYKECRVTFGAGSIIKLIRCEV